MDHSEPLTDKKWITEKLLYEGKAKRVYSLIGHEDKVLIEFKDSLTAFNALKKGDFAGKGKVNKEITALLFDFLQRQEIKTHWIANVGSDSVVAKKLTIIPLEVVVRNTLAGSTAKKLGIAEGTPLDKPLIEFYYKDDALGDPFLSDDQALMLKAASPEELVYLKQEALRINSVLIPLFLKLNLKLIDFKVEFGKDQKGQILLADEITPDCCRLWDVQTLEKMDKDRFRRDLGAVKETYEEVLLRLKKVLP